MYLNIELLHEVLFHRYWCGRFIIVLYKLCHVLTVEDRNLFEGDWWFRKFGSRDDECHVSGLISDTVTTVEALLRRFEALSGF